MTCYAGIVNPHDLMHDRDRRPSDDPAASPVPHTPARLAGRQAMTRSDSADAYRWSTRTALLSLDRRTCPIRLSPFPWSWQGPRSVTSGLPPSSS